MLLKVPFYKNTKDDMHCFQACLKMILKYYFPRKNYSYRELDKLSGHKKGKLTWQGASLLALSRLGLEVVNMENLDYRQFAKRGESYLKLIWSEEVFGVQSKHSNLAYEQRIAGRLIKNKRISLVNKVVGISDIEKFFKKKFLVLVAVNSSVFLGQRGYRPHMVFISDVDKKTLTFHDPGLPPMENRKVGRALFKRAISPPWREDTNLIAIRRR